VNPVAASSARVENTRPELEVKSRRVGGATYQVPVEVRPRGATTLAIRWLTTYSRQRREKTMPNAWPARSWMHPTTSAPPSSAVRTCTRWRNPIRHSPTTLVVDRNSIRRNTTHHG